MRRADLPTWSAIDQRREIRNSYAKGYAAGMKREWPQWTPIVPPHDPVIAELLTAGAEMREAAEGWVQAFGWEDEVCKQMAPAVDRWWKAQNAYHEWLKDNAAKEST